MGEVMQRQFKGIWIPADIWLSEELTIIDKFLLADIDSFTGNGKQFYKSNETIAKELFVSMKSISRSVKRLAELGLIEVSGNTRRRILTSNLGHNDKDSRHSDLNSGQGVRTIGTKRPPTNTRSSSKINKKTIEVELPFSSTEFKDMWNEWKRHRKKAYADGGKRALNRLVKLSNNNEREAIDIIDFSLAQNYSGLYKENKNGKKFNNNKSFDTDKFKDHIHTL